MVDKPVAQTTPPRIAVFERQGDVTAIIPEVAYLGGWNKQVRALEAEVARLRGAIAGAQTAFCYEDRDAAMRILVETGVQNGR